MKRGQPRRDWRDAREKVQIEAESTGCRACGVFAGLQAAHIAPRRVDRPRTEDSKTLYVHPDRILPLCPECHGRMDSGRLDTLGLLTLAEQVQAVIDLGGIEAARIRLVPSEYSKLPDRGVA